MDCFRLDWAFGSCGKGRCRLVMYIWMISIRWLAREDGDEEVRNNIWGYLGVGGATTVERYSRDTDGAWEIT